VCMCDTAGEPRHADVACVHGNYGCSVWKCDSQRCCCNSLIDDVCGVRGAQVAKCVASRGSGCFPAVRAIGNVGGACPVVGAVVGVFIIVHETRIKVVSWGCCGRFHRQSGIDTIILWINCYFYFIIPCPSMSSLIWPGICGNNRFVNDVP
jgi:hypothetical protein